MPTAQLARAVAVEHKTFGAPMLDTPDDQPGFISAIVAVFNNVDSGNDRIIPGFFAKSIARKLPKGVWGHDWETPIAKTLEARELHPGDPMLPPGLTELGGLYIKAAFNLDTQRGREAYSDIKFGIIDEFSIGYRALEFEVDKKTGVRDLIEGDILEWSAVLVGMNDRTRLLTLKSSKSASKAIVPASGQGFDDSARMVESAVGSFVRRVVSRAEARAKDGREFSGRNIVSLESVADSMEEGARTIRSLVERAKPTPAPKSDDVTASEKGDRPPEPASLVPIEPATPAVALPAPVEPAIPPASVPAPGPDDADILAQYALTQYALTMAAVRSSMTHG